MLHRLLYTSQAAEGVDMRDVFDIIRVSHNRNSQSGLTGGLLLLDGFFYQILEGLPSVVRERYKRIAIDPRHHSLELRLEQVIEEPLFESDWMALRDGSQVDPQLLQKHDYQPGMPNGMRTGQEVFDLLIECFDQELAACK